MSRFVQMHLTRFLLQTLLFSHLLLFACQSVSKIYWGYTFESAASLTTALCGLSQIADLVLNPQSFILSYSVQDFFPGTLNLAGLILGLLVYTFYSTKISQCYACLFKHLLSCFRPSTTPFHYRVTNSIGRIFLQLLLVLWVFNTLYDASYFVLRDAAHLVDGAGAYEIGERIFSLGSNDSGVTLASTCGSYAGHDFDIKELKNERLNREVEEIYGGGSIQMANRYSILAGHYFLRDECTEGERYYEKAVYLYKKLRRPHEVVTCLSFLAFAQAKRNACPAARTSIMEVIQIVASIDEPLVHKRSELLKLYPAAFQLGDKKLAKAILEGTIVKNSESIKLRLSSCVQKQAFARK